MVLAIFMVIGSGLLGMPGLVADSGTVQEVVFGWLLIILAAILFLCWCFWGLMYSVSGFFPDYACGLEFIFLYGFTLLSCWKTEKGLRSWVYSGLFLLSFSFLVSGFTWKILYSIVLIGIGYYGFVRKTAGQKNRDEKTACIACPDLRSESLNHSP